MRQKSGNAAEGRVPNMTVISGTRAPQWDAASEHKAEKRPFIIRYGKHLRGFFEIGRAHV